MPMKNDLIGLLSQHQLKNLSKLVEKFSFLNVFGIENALEKIEIGLD